MARLTLTLVVAFGLMPFLAGCEREMKTKTTEKVTGPGGTTTKTVEAKVESTGENPPATKSGEAVPPNTKTEKTTTTIEETKPANP